MTPDNSQIKLVFKNQTIFLTGATGFLGKVMIAKLLRDCEDIKKIYILLRSKKGKNSEQRFEEIFEQPVSIDSFLKILYILFSVLSS